MIKKYSLLAVLSTLSLLGCIYLFQLFIEKHDLVVIERLETRSSNVEIQMWIDQINNASSSDDLHEMKDNISSLPDGIKSSLMPIVFLKSATFKFRQAETYMARAKKLHESISVEDKPQGEPPTEYDEYGNPITRPPVPAKVPHPLVVEALNDALKLYKESKDEIDLVGEIENSNDFNFVLNYTKGEIYFRATQFLSNEETAAEYFNQTVESFKKALKFNPRNINTEINIELLINKKDEMLQNANKPGHQRLRQLQQIQPGTGNNQGVF
jgi:tetratricopeptide (TPR) repeat protein